jgi:hypothetical protein
VKKINKYSFFLSFFQIAGVDLEDVEDLRRGPTWERPGMIQHWLNFEEWLQILRVQRVEAYKGIAGLPSLVPPTSSATGGEGETH